MYMCMCCACVIIYCMLLQSQNDDAWLLIECKLFHIVVAIKHMFSIQQQQKKNAEIPFLYACHLSSLNEAHNVAYGNMYMPRK